MKFSPFMKNVALFASGVVIGVVFVLSTLPKQSPQYIELELPEKPTKVLKESDDVRYSKSGLVRYNSLDLDCLTANIYHEARGQKAIGMKAVALVTINRVKSIKYPPTVCGVVTQKRKGVCQFSWYCDDLPDRPDLSHKSNLKSWVEAEHIAKYVLQYEHKYHKNVNTLYHADYVNPQWVNVTKTEVIGNHIFYKEI